MHDQSVIFRETADGVLVAPARCGLLTVPDLISHVRAWCASDATGDLVVDLSGVDYMEDAAFGALMWTRRYCASVGRRMAIVPPRSGVLQRPQELALQTLASVSPTRTGAAEPLATA